MMRTPRDMDRSAMSGAGTGTKAHGTWWLIVASIASVTAGGIWGAGCVYKTDPEFCQVATDCGEPGETGWMCDNTNTCRRVGNDADPDGIDAMPLPPDASVCTGNDDCPGGTPYCKDAAICVECIEDEHCSMSDGGPNPNGTQCLGNNLCGCETHADCPDSEVCGTDGICIPAGDVIIVDNNSTASMDIDECGTQATPCLSIQKAIERARPWIVVRGGGPPYATPSPLNDVTVHMLGKDEASIQGTTSGLSPGIYVTGDSTVTLENLLIQNIADADDSAVFCEGGSLRIVGLTIEGINGVGVKGSNCTLTVERSTITRFNQSGIQVAGGSFTLQSSTVQGNTGGGVQIDGGEFTLTNNMIVGNGAVASDFGGVYIRGSVVTGQLLFNTVVGNNNVANGEGAGGVRCSQTGEVTAENNIVAVNLPNTVPSIEPQVSGTMCRWRYSVIPQTPAVAGEGMSDIDCERNPTTFKLAANSACIDTADPAATVSEDFEGDPRPQGMADIGADEFR